MIRFTIKGSKVTIEPRYLTIEAFAAIWEFDKGKDKRKATKMFAYVFFVSDLTSENPYIDMAPANRDAMARQNCFGKKDYKFSKEEAVLIENACTWYEMLSENQTLRAYRIICDSIDTLSNKINKENNVEEPNVENISEWTSKQVKLIMDREKMHSIVKKEESKTIAKGDKLSSPMEKNLLKIRGVD
jgi:hypothetical protein